ncbi:MAG: STAS domain-containing protein [Alphaproteobacteria bacterium]|nr:STAS domain-containing protein [Alphaproteobacteria bacterium]
MCEHKKIAHDNPDITMISFEGVLTFEDSEAIANLLSVLRKRLPSYKEVHLMVDKLDHIDASGLLMLMMAHDLAKKEHLSLVFVKPYGQVQEALLEAARYNKLNIAA